MSGTRFKRRITRKSEALDPDLYNFASDSDSPANEQTRRNTSANSSRNETRAFTRSNVGNMSTLEGLSKSRILPQEDDEPDSPAPLPKRQKTEKVLNNRDFSIVVESSPKSLLRKNGTKSSSKLKDISLSNGTEDSFHFAALNEDTNENIDQSTEIALESLKSNKARKRPAPPATKASRGRAGRKTTENSQVQAPRISDASEHSNDIAIEPVTPNQSPSNSRDTVQPIPLTTPVQMRSLAQKAETASARRRSISGGPPILIDRSMTPRGSSRRASRGGFESNPHPSIQSSMLYRYTNPGDPFHVRMKSVLGWIGRRRVEAMSWDQDDDEVTTRALEIIEDWLGDVSAGRVDTSVGKSQGSGYLPPHPQNQVNSIKMQELSNTYAAIEEETQKRELVKARYSSLQEPPVLLHQLVKGWDTSQVEFNKSASLHLGSDDDASGMQKMVEFGKKIMYAEDSNKRGKNRATEDDSMKQIEALMRDVRIQIPRLHTLVHRQASMGTLASAYISSRLSTANHSLNVRNLAGIGSKVSQDREGLEGVRLLVKEGEDRDIDARDLLRGISRSQQSSKR